MCASTIGWIVYMFPQRPRVWWYVRASWQRPGDDTNECKISTAKVPFVLLLSSAHIIGAGLGGDVMYEKSRGAQKHMERRSWCPQWSCPVGGSVFAIFYHWSVVDVPGWVSSLGSFCYHWRLMTKDEYQMHFRISSYRIIHVLPPLERKTFVARNWEKHSSNTQPCGVPPFRDTQHNLVFRDPQT